jgi:PAS domain-containing protein
MISDIKGGTQIVFVNRVLRRIFGEKRGELTGSWRKLHNEELHNITIE